MKENQDRKNEEIDLFFFLRLFKNWARKFGLFIRKCIKINVHSWKILLATLVIGSIIGILIGKMEKPVYSSEILIGINDAGIRNDYVESIIDDLSEIVSNRDYNLVSELLNSEVNLVKEIHEISYELFNNSILEDTVHLGLPFKIKVEVFNNSILDTLDGVLVNFLENNAYFTKRQKINKFKIESMINNLESNLEDLDSLKDIISANIVPKETKIGSSFVFGEPLDPLNSYGKSLALFEDKINYTNKLNFSNSFDLIKSFVPRNERSNLGPVKWCVIVAFIAYFVMVLFFYFKNPVLEEARHN